MKDESLNKLYENINESAEFQDIRKLCVSESKASDAQMCKIASQYCTAQGKLTFLFQKNLRFFLHNKKSCCNYHRLTTTNKKC